MSLRPPTILFENFFALGSLTASSAETAYPVNGLADWRKTPSSQWRPSDLSSGQWVRVDLGAGNELAPEALAVGGHNLNAAEASLVVAYSDDDAAWTDLATMQVPATQRPKLDHLPSAGAHRYWRVQFNRAGGGNYPAQPQVGILTLGRALELPGLKPSLDPHAQQFVTDWPQNRFGDYLGTNYRYSERRILLEYSDVGIDVEWFHPTSGIGWETDFVPHARGKPFWFVFTDLAREWDTIELCRMEAYEAPMAENVRRYNLFATLMVNREP